MTNHYHAAVWIDHHEARVFHFNATDVDEIVVHPEHPTRHIHHKANSIGSGHTSEDHAFFQDVISAIGTASAILVTGPANAKLTVAQFALAWVLRQPNVTSAIVGASRPEQVNDNAAASGAHVEPSLFTEAERLLPSR